VGAARFDLRLWVAQGFGIGRVPFAPGTFGSLLGLLWFAFLLSLGNWVWFGLGTVVGFFISVWLCGAGEKILSQKDPGSVVLDEITALPFCFVAAIATWIHRHGKWPMLQEFFAARNWLWCLGILALFRIFDIAKPWPVKQSQSLPGGWGVTVDDFLAAIYVNLVASLGWYFKNLLY